MSNILVTNKALDYLNKYFLSHPDDKCLRLGVKGSGCQGFEYIIKFESKMLNKDILFDNQIIIDNKSILYLNNITLDYYKSLMNSGFKIINPQQDSTCGCGNSFSIKEKM